MCLVDANEHISKFYSNPPLILRCLLGLFGMQLQWTVILIQLNRRGPSNSTHTLCVNISYMIQLHDNYAQTYKIRILFIVQHNNGNQIIHLLHSYLEA